MQIQENVTRSSSNVGATVKRTGSFFPQLVHVDGFKGKAYANLPVQRPLQRQNS